MYGKEFNRVKVDKLMAILKEEKVEWKVGQKDMRQKACVKVRLVDY